MLKWIHLNHGDVSILHLIQHCHSILSPNGAVVVELQGWKSYKKWVKRLSAFKQTPVDNIKPSPANPSSSSQDFLTQRHSILASTQSLSGSTSALSDDYVSKVKGHVLKLRPFTDTTTFLNTQKNTNEEPLEDFWDLFMHCGFEGKVLNDGTDGGGFDSRPLWLFVKR